MADPADITIRAATEADIVDLSNVLAEAFSADPLIKWLFPEREVLNAYLPSAFEGQLRHSILPMGAVDIAVDAKSHATLGGALWVPPGRSESIWGLIRQAMPLLRPIGARLWPIFQALSEIDKHAPNRPHWYLSAVGVDPAFGGTRVGTRLLEHRLTIADSEGIASYLESASRDNQDFYARFGFELREEIHFQDGPTVWTMLRRPK